MLKFLNLRKPRFAGICLIISLFLIGNGFSVTSNIVKHSSSDDFLKGKTEDVVISSRGTLELALNSKIIAGSLEDAWSVNQIVVTGSDIYLGTSPNGGIYRYSLNKLEKIYPLQEQENQQAEPADSNDTSEPNSSPDSNNIEEDTHLQNEHIFAMGEDITGRLIAGISDENCRLIRLQEGEFRTVFEPNDASYIFSIAIAKNGGIYVGTGPEGKIYKLDSLAEKAELLYDSEDKNILSLSPANNNILYAGSDTRGLVYRISTETKEADVLYDSDYPEITSVVSYEDSVYAAGTSANIKESEMEFAANQTGEGRPESNGSENTPSPDAQADNPLILKIPNSADSAPQKPSGKPQISRSRPGKVSSIYKLDQQGFVEDIFQEKAVFLCMVKQDDELLVGTGGNGQLFRIDSKAEVQKVIYDDPNAPQITSLAVSGNNIFIGTANPAKLVKLTPDYSSRGTFTSDLIDAGQPARWGKLQIDGEIPTNCEVLTAARSGNVKDVNAPTFSDWTDYSKVVQPVELDCPVGRFCQYKLLLETSSPNDTPVIKEVAIANTVPNIAPQVTTVSVEKAEKEPGVLKISYNAKDDNSDKLIYKIDFRQVGWGNWIELKDNIKENHFLWDSQTVEDGRYEIRVTANDRKSNSEKTALTASRVSEQFVIDNAGPTVEEIKFERNQDKAEISVSITDKLSVITNLEYTVNSSEDWMSSVPEDLVFDTTKETFNIEINDLEEGKHILSLKLTDATGNTTYKNFQF